MLSTQFKTKTRNQIASEYGIDYKTFMRRLKKHDIHVPAGLVYPNYQIYIYETLGYPSVELKMEFDKI
jgi:hypothetical protein